MDSDLTKVQAMECDTTARKHRVYFIGPALIGMLAFVSYKVFGNRSDSIIDGDSLYVMRYLQIYDFIALPRTNFELIQIAAIKGKIYGFVSTVMMALCSTFGLLALLAAIRSSRPVEGFGLITSANKKVAAAFIIVVGTLIVRPADFGPNFLRWANRVDNDGIYFLREGMLNDSPGKFMPTSAERARSRDN